MCFANQLRYHVQKNSDISCWLQARNGEQTFKNGLLRSYYYETTVAKLSDLLINLNQFVQVAFLAFLCSAPGCWQVIGIPSERSVKQKQRFQILSATNMAESKGRSYGLSADVQRKVQVKHYSRSSCFNCFVSEIEFLRWSHLFESHLSILISQLIPVRQN